MAFPKVRNAATMSHPEQSLAPIIIFSNYVDGHVFLKTHLLDLRVGFGGTSYQMS